MTLSTDANGILELSDAPVEVINPMTKEGIKNPSAETGNFSSFQEFSCCLEEGWNWCTASLSIMLWLAFLLHPCQFN